MKNSPMKGLLLEFLDFLRYKVSEDRMTMDDMQSLSKTVASGLDLKATAKELAGFYGQTEHNVRNVIHCHLLPAPERRVYYSFKAFQRVKPEKWSKKSAITR